MEGTDAHCVHFCLPAWGLYVFSKQDSSRVSKERKEATRWNYLEADKEGNMTLVERQLCSKNQQKSEGKKHSGL